MEEFIDVLDVGRRGRVRNAEVGRGNEGKQHDEAEKRQGEEQIDTESTYEEDKARDRPVSKSVAAKR